MTAPHRSVLVTAVARGIWPSLCQEVNPRIDFTL